MGVRHLRRVVVLALWLGLASFVGLGCGEDATDLTETDFFAPRDYGDYEFDRQPDIDGPERVAFMDVVVGETLRREVIVENVGKNFLTIDRIRIEGPFEMRIEPAMRPPVELAPEETLTVEITYTARSAEGARGRLVVESNDPDEPVFEVDLLANMDLPCLAVSAEPTLDFGTRELGQTHRETFTVANCARRSEVSFVLERFGGDGEFDVVSPVLGRPQTLAPGEQVEVEVSFRPERPGDYAAELTLRSNDEEQPERTVELIGRGRPYDCPRAIIRASHPQRGEAIADPEATLQTVPLDEITLESISRDPEGEGIAQVEWSLVHKPQDATVELQDGPAGKMMWMQLAGTYVVELRVWSELGVESCQPARMTLEAVADEDVHIQLVWNTPRDSDQTDGRGTDMDLHFLHPMGEWNSTPYDCFWRNKSPNWGEYGRVDDDPSLDIDDVDGSGPENINLDNPEADSTYQVGVFYYDDHRFGPSFATVRVYLGGILEVELSGREMSRKQFWNVARVHWPDGRVETVDRIHDWFP